MPYGILNLLPVAFSYVLVFLVVFSPQSLAGENANCIEREKPRGHAPASGANRIPPRLTATQRKEIASRKYNVLYRKLVADSQFRNVAAEAQGLRALGAEAGVSSVGVQFLINHLVKRGTDAVARERRSCGGHIDYSPRIGPVRNQDTVGWCYAFALADNMTFITGRRISGAGIATAYNSYWRWVYRLFQPYCGEGKAGWGGNQTLASFVSSRSGLCLESQFPSEDNGPGRIYDKIVALERAQRSGNAENFKACSLDLFPNLKHKDIMEVLRTSSQQELLKSLSDKACVNRIPMPRVNSDYYGGSVNSPATLFRRIDEALTSGKLATMGYSTSMLYNIDKVTGEGGHSSLIVGRKWDAGKNECVYLVRNSYGPGCRQYDRRLECRSGHIWVPKSVMAKGVTSVSVLR